VILYRRIVLVWAMERSTWDTRPARLNRLIPRVMVDSGSLPELMSLDGAENYYLELTPVGDD
jgi:hypothetical protein